DRCREGIIDVLCADVELFGQVLLGLSGGHRCRDGFPRRRRRRPGRMAAASGVNEVGRSSPMSTDQVLLGVGLIVVLAVGSQVAASLLRIPALIILLPAGFIAGALTTDINPAQL